MGVTQEQFVESLADKWTWDVERNVKQQDGMVVDAYRGHHPEWGCVALRIREPIPPPEVLLVGPMRFPTHGSVWVILVSHKASASTFQANRVMAEMIGSDIEAEAAGEQ